jgi:hypothetical protein
MSGVGVAVPPDEDLPEVESLCTGKMFGH